MQIKPFKNYIILAIIFLFTIGITFFLVKYHNDVQKYYQENSIMSTFVFEIKEDNISSYILENPTIMIYVSSGSDNEAKTFEKKLKSLIEQYGIKDDFVYFNIDNEDYSAFYPKIKDLYFSEQLKQQNLSFSIDPTILYFQDGYITDILFKKQDTTINDVKLFLIKQGVIVDD